MAHEDEKATPADAGQVELPVRLGCCAVSLSGADHFPRGTTWYVHWLPKGYRPTSEDRFMCAFHDAGSDWCEAGYSLKAGARPPVIEAAVRAIEEYMRAEQERIAGLNVELTGAKRPGSMKGSAS